MSIFSLTNGHRKIGKVPTAVEECYALFGEDDCRLVVLRGFAKRVAKALVRKLYLCRGGGYANEVEVQQPIDDRFIAMVTVTMMFKVDENGHVKLPETSLLYDTVFDTCTCEEIEGSSVVINEREVNRILQKHLQDSISDFLREAVY